MTYSFHRGSLSLDFAGTVGSRTSDAPEERMADPGALGTWLGEAGLVAGAAPTARDLNAAYALREAIYALGSAIAGGHPLRSADLEIVNSAAADLRRGAPRLGRNQQVEWVTSAPVALALARVALDAIERFSADGERVTLCELEGCGALLLSRSRSEKRRWCSMELCGNRHKVAAYRARQRKERA